MRFWVLGSRLALAYLTLAAPMARGGSTVDAAPHTELKAVHDTFLKGLTAEDPEKMLEAYSKSASAKIRAEMKSVSKEEAEMFVIMHLAVAPETYELKHVAYSKNGQKARLFLLLHLGPNPDFEGVPAPGGAAAPGTERPLRCGKTFARR